MILLFVGGYLYYMVEQICPIPHEYRIGVIDERFDLSSEEAQGIVEEAANIWETAVGRELFIFDEAGNLTINFVFDERQAFSEAETDFRERLDAAENINDAIGQTYEQLVDQYESVKSEYETKVTTYEARLSTYNETVRTYNEEGGAPQGEFERLEEEKNELDAEQAAINVLASQLNDLVEEINNIGEKGNTLIEAYNEEVTEYNQTFGESREFTQGDYQNETINIYTYKDFEELRVVLVHELGHALQLGHVDGEESIMYHLIGKQPRTGELSQSDIAEFNRICGDISFWDKMRVLFNKYD